MGVAESAIRQRMSAISRTVQVATGSVNEMQLLS